LADFRIYFERTSPRKKWLLIQSIRSVGFIESVSCSPYNANTSGGVSGSAQSRARMPVGANIRWTPADRAFERDGSSGGASRGLVNKWQYFRARSRIQAEISQLVPFREL